MNQIIKTYNIPFYPSFNEYLRNRFGQRVQRVSLHAGFTCPNRDGTKGTGGCIYCDNRSFNPHADSNRSVHDQLIDGMAHARLRYGARRFLAYFQTYSNTYADPDTLRNWYRSVIHEPDIVGMMISTRPDCLSDPIVAVLKEMAEIKLIWVEIGVQSAHNPTLERIHRCHTWEESADAIQRVHQAGLSVAAHVILGLPGESRKDMIQTAECLSGLHVEGIKLHHMHAVKGTRLAEMFHSGEWFPLTESEYIETASECLLRLSPETVVMRWVGECPDALLVAPRWNLPKQEIQRQIRDRLSQKH